MSVRSTIPMTSWRNCKMKPKIYPIGKIWKSEANGWVYHRGGVSPTLCCGAHNGVQPKIIVYEDFGAERPGESGPTATML